MDWADALEAICIKHGPAFEPGERELLERAMNSSISGAFDMATGGFDSQVSENANDPYDTLEKFRDALFARARSQSSL